MADNVLYVGEISKFAEEDNYKIGCCGGGSFSGVIETLRGSSLHELIAAAADFVGVPADSGYYDEFNNQVQFSRMENGEGEEASENELTQWKRGRLRLWSADYFLTVRRSVEVAPDVLAAACGAN